MVTTRLLKAGLPMWNGLFCAMLPEYTSQGIGSKMFERGVQLFSGAWKKQLNHLSTQKISSPKLTKKQSTEDNKSTSKENQLILASKKSQTAGISKPNTNNCHTCSSNSIDSSKPQQQKGSFESCGFLSTVKTKERTLTTQVLIAISHGERAAHFYKMNGFQNLFHTEYADEGISFKVNVFALDPLKRLGVAQNSNI